MGAQPEHQPEQDPGPSGPVTWLNRNPLPPADPPGPQPQADLSQGPGGTQRRWWIAAAVAALLVVTGVVVATRTSSSGASTAGETGQSVPLVTVSAPGLRPVATRVSFTGTIAARYDMPIGADGEGGRITAVNVDVGDTVRKGQVLARLDDSVLRPQVARLRAALEEARAQAALSQAEYRRAQGVEAAGALSAEEIERRRAAAVTDAARVEVAAAQLAEAEARLERTWIRAPADGVVLTRNAEVGQTAVPGGEPLFRLAKDGEVELRGKVAEQDLPALAVGQSADVYLTGIPTPFKGRVRLLGAVIDPQTRLGEVRIALPPHPALRPGAFARAEVVVSEAQLPVLPQTAVLSDTRGNYVFVVNGDNVVERRDVRVGGTVREGIVIASGLDGNERIVTTAGGFLREGEIVAVAPPAVDGTKKAESSG